MMKISIFTLLFVIVPFFVIAQSSNDEEVLRNLLDEFLEGATYNDPEIHDRFWADDLVYTGSAGNRTTKSEIMNGMTEPANYDEEPELKYHGEEVQVNVYGEAAIVAFKLVAVSSTSAERMEYYNTGTFLKRDGQWKAVAWQATRIPE